MPRPITTTFATSSYAAHFSKDNPTAPESIAIRSRRIFKFHCPNCRHQFASSPDRLYLYRNGPVCGEGCPYCKKGKLCDLESCQHCWPRRFASHVKSKFCRDKLLPWKVSLNSIKIKLEFVCGICQHEFASKPNNVTSGQWCPCCANKELCSPDKIHECVHCWNKAFISQEKSEHWMLEKNNFITPLEVALNSNTKFWFRCDKNRAHEFKMRPCNVNRGQWCPHCRNKTEELVYSWCQEWFGDTSRQARFDWCGNRRFDIHIPSLRTIIEVDGGQHFDNVKFWKTDYKEQQERDVEKSLRALANDMRIVRIRQSDVCRDPEKWKAELQKRLREIECPQWLSPDEARLQWLSADEAAYEGHKQLLGQHADSELTGARPAFP